MSTRIGVIGAGMIGQDHIRRLTAVISGAHVVAIADADASRAIEIAAGIPGCRVVDASELVDDPEVDAVVVTSWGATHAEFVLAAIAAQKPVFCEKPLATTLADCERIIAAETALGRRLVQVGFMRRYDRQFRLLRTAVASGELGVPLLLHCAHRMGSVPAGYTTEQVVNDAIVHEIDTARWILDEEIVGVRVLPTRHNPSAPLSLTDPCLVVLSSESGVSIDVEASAHGAYGYDIRAEVVGQHGTSELVTERGPRIRASGRASRAIAEDWRERFVEAYDTELQEWVDQLGAGSSAHGPNSWDGLAATAVTDAIHRALTSGEEERIALPPRPDLYGALS
ncbi:Gfo/Idh/MocA family oxidoreductase [Leucobacter japonicus]|uniref:Gfo/Idh/MocA family oxidoreductase n=1 Tax=Leucobacter japonicus TaxID=1461259 RepID=UPI0006A78540|nr:Gfo/Idh/MocA family oxidoreductase [Leucobacter japonicus]